MAGRPHWPARLRQAQSASDSPNLGVNLDTGNLHTKDPYDDLARVAPYAVNVQVKTEIRREGKTTEPADLSQFTSGR